MANLVYCQPGVKTRVIELFQASCINACYARICQQKGLDYTAIVNPDMPGQNADGTPKEIKTRNDMWLVADIFLLEKVLTA
ncbi:glycosyltransferase 61 family protein [Agrobacterium vitis]|uniref:Glycosyltransferase family 61 protein n=1 Tax=Agrobacterium vitis TaxID=373 RepID=A0AAE2RFH8_AGRVI|nr:glycosyltransferase 61 family protein [Agrobacterium vitis]MBF2717580.1 glycosyltransferase family 61 protein [Agrobacterium vitis]